MREGVQQVDAHQPVGVAPVQPAAGAHRRNARHVGAVGEGGADDVELVLDAPDAAVERADIELALEFAAAEHRVLLRVDRLLQFGWFGSAIASKVALSQLTPVKRRKMKLLNLV